MLAQATDHQLAAVEIRCRLESSGINDLALTIVHREVSERAFAADRAARCDGMTFGCGFARCTRPARNLVADEYFGETFKGDRLVRSARLIEFWGACHQHQKSFRADSPQGSALDAWNRLDPLGSGCFNGRRLGSIKLPPA